ncbi:hypothetical protein [Noviherbaspirillum galbum]|uniref:Uncharacterized protein n=1 Tax=Noviherbaspirillum galbum TaxID=2709383 RepID=A0A6B3SU54_9BURK|nr:hypothetical protein [Noviherbaspirillum galbum]NEX63998.1 hypothetical protein [Noviherbaspirillum galbum]
MNHQTFGREAAGSIVFASESARERTPLRRRDGDGIRTRFGELVDVRHRGALRLARLTGLQVPQTDMPAVVRLWNGDICKEMSIHEARALAAQLLEAAACAEGQNRR